MVLLLKIIFKEKAIEELVLVSQGHEIHRLTFSFRFQNRMKNRRKMLEFLFINLRASSFIATNKTYVVGFCCEICMYIQKNILNHT